MSMFDAAMRAIFYSMVGTQMTYTPQGGQPVTISGLMRKPDVTQDLGKSKVRQDATVFEILVSDIATISTSDQITVGTQTYRIMTSYITDADRLIHLVEAAAI